MKFDVLRSVGHNIAHSLSSGVSLLVGEDGFDIHAEASRTREGTIEVDVLAGTVSGGQASPDLARVVAKLAAALPGLCERQGVSASAFRCLRARYLGARDGGFVVVVEDQAGRRAEDDYVGGSGGRPRLLGPRGEARRKKVAVTRPRPMGRV